MEKFKNIGRSAWGFFSRPLGTSTPCSEVKNKFFHNFSNIQSANKNTYYTPNKYRRYGPDYGSGFNSSLGKKDGGMLSPDSSRWMSYSFFGFLVLLAACYLYQAHTETVTSGLEKGKGLRFICIINYNENFQPIKDLRLLKLKLLMKIKGPGRIRTWAIHFYKIKLLFFF